MIEQIKQLKGTIITVASLIGFGFWSYPQIEKVAAPLRDIADTLESLEHKVDSIGKWTELRFQGSDVEMARVQEKIQANSSMINFAHRNDSDE